MFEFKKVKHLRIEPKSIFYPESLFIKYEGEEERFLTNGKIDLKEFKKTQKSYYQEARRKTNEMAKGWKQRYYNYLKIKKLI